MGTTFKVFIGFPTIPFLFYILGFWPRGMWDLISLTRDQALTPSIGRHSLNHQIAREVLSGSHLECVCETIVNCMYDSSSF